MTNKPIWFNKGKFYIKNDTIDAYYDLADGLFHSARTGQAYKDVMPHFYSLLLSLKMSKSYSFSAKEAAFILLCDYYSLPITDILSLECYNKMVQIEKVLSLFSFPESQDFINERYSHLFLDLSSRDIPASKWAKIWKEVPDEERKNLPRFVGWAESYLDNERKEKLKHEIQKYTSNERTIDFFLKIQVPFYSDLFQEECLPRAIYYFERGAYEYYYDVSNSRWEQEAARALLSLFRHCRTMRVKPPKENWFIAYTQVLKNFNVWQNKTTTILFKEKQSQRLSELSFQDDKFIALVPTTSDQFIQEAAAQRNCVNETYKQKVANGKTHIVFIRERNNPEKSLITCEVDNNGIIRQYLAKNNTVLDNDEPAMDFYKKYQQHLTEVWNA